MSTIIIYTDGTLGDHLPFIALGQTLQGRGHSVRLVMNRAFHAFAGRAGLEAVALTDIDRGPEHVREFAWAWDHWTQPGPNLPPIPAHVTLESFETRARGLVGICAGSDLLISTSIRHLGYLVHHVLGLPWLTASMNPALFERPGPEQAQAEARARKVQAKLLAHLFNHLDYPLPAPPATLWGYLSRHLILASSSHFSRPYVDHFPASLDLHQTGFWFYEDPDWAGWQPDEKLRAFLAQERRPIVLAFSSQPLQNPGETLAVHARAAAQLGYPLLIQRGWAGFSEQDLPPDCDPDNIFFADFLPHDWLFARAACAIQHGGIGSIARALQQGCPLLIEPYGNDQAPNATRVMKLGVGAAMHPHKLTVEGVVRVLRDKVLTPAYRQRAAAVGQMLAGEDGPAAACEYIETFLETRPASRTASLVQPAAVEPAAGIPRLIHQTWKEDRDLLPAWQEFQRTWQAHHPGWVYRFWTDADLRDFIRRRYPWFLPIYDDYPEPIMRVDAARYFIMHHYGGIYADLDFECLRPLEPLLAGKTLVFGLEPPAHVRQHRDRGLADLEQIVCNAFIASAPGHPFWEHCFRQLLTYHKMPDTLDATGPFMLSRAYRSYPRLDNIRVEPAAVLYPVHGEQAWRDLPAAERERLGREAYAVHHWHGSWWREPVQRQQRQLRVSLAQQGRVIGRAALDPAALPAAGPPRVSALMVTKGRPGLALRSIHCFRRQTYPNKELVIVDDDPDETLARRAAELADSRICYVRLPAENKTLGELRNLAVGRATGAYVAQWDDDDLSLPERLQAQMAAILALQVEACFLQRQLIWWPDRERLAVSGRRVWEGSFVCLKDRLPAYPAQRQGEDTPVAAQVVKAGRVALLDAPHLYVYIFHGRNTFNVGHWEEHWRAASAAYEGEIYRAMLAGLLARLGLEQGQADLSPAAG